MHCLDLLKRKKIFSRRIKESNKINTMESEKDICRICLEESVGLDWNTTMLRYNGMTYKDCYYKYTQLEYHDADPFPEMLCHNCCNALISTHTLILKALESQEFFKEKYSQQKKFEADNLTINTSTDHSRRGDIKYAPTVFETVVVEKIELEPIIDDYFDYDDLDEEVQVKENAVVENPIRTKTGERESKTEDKADAPLKEHPNHSLEISTSKRKLEVKVKKSKTIAIAANDIQSISTESGNSKEEKQEVKESAVVENPIRTKTGERKSKTEDKADVPLKEHPNHSLEISTSKRKLEVKVKKSKTIAIAANDIQSISTERGNSKEEKQEECNYIETDSKDDIKNVEPKDEKKSKEKKEPGVCSICSKIILNKYAIRRHEQTHIENRERKETCPVCGLKLFNKTNLYSHMQTHKENREKRHKCEFCSKAFYEKGGLTVHRRIHLGQMIPCTLCSKQYFRQIDLERHMSSHSATAINTDAKKIAKYYVRCKHCDKSIRSTSFKAHMAAHSNEPVMQCTICSKEFFGRVSCVKHLRRVHQKTKEEYDDFIVIYKKNRISHLFLEQKANIQSNNE